MDVVDDHEVQRVGHGDVDGSAIYFEGEYSVSSLVVFGDEVDGGGFGVCFAEVDIGYVDGFLEGLADLFGGDHPHLDEDLAEEPTVLFLTVERRLKMGFFDKPGLQQSLAEHSHQSGGRTGSFPHSRSFRNATIKNKSESVALY